MDAGGPKQAQVHQGYSFGPRIAMDGVKTTSVAGEDASSVMSDLSTDAFRNGLKGDLLDALSVIQPSGSFASFHDLNKMNNAGLNVLGVGPIDTSSSLDASTARQLIAKARQAPFGKGSETIVDTSVRNTWELDPDQFSFSHPRWDYFMQIICDQVAAELGINTTIRAEVYKMLIYEKGAMIKPHTDTEKIPGMFGTLVLCLPSPHTGGEVVVKHRGKKKVFKTSEAECSMVCWYSDVTHEVLPVTSGYRWVVTYNLAVDTSVVRPSAALQRYGVKPLHHTLRRWVSQRPEVRKHGAVYHVLDHDCTQANIRTSILRTRDLAQVQALKEASKDLPFEIFLAVLEKVETGDVDDDGTAYREHLRRRKQNRGRRRPLCVEDDFLESESDEVESESDHSESPSDHAEENSYHKIIDILDEDYRIKTLFDLHGRTVLENMRFNEEDILDEYCFDNMDGEEKFEGYMGNWGPQATHWYRRAAVVIVPKDSVVRFLHCDKPSRLSRTELPSLIQYWARKSRHDKASDSDISTVEELCELAWEKWENSRGMERVSLAPFDSQTSLEILKAAVHAGRHDLFEMNVSRHEGLLPLIFYEWVRVWIFQKSGGRDDVIHRFESLQDGLTSSVFGYKSLSMQLEAINIFTFTLCRSPRTFESYPMTQAWAHYTLEACLNTRHEQALVSSNAGTVVDLLFCLNNALEFLSTSIIPAVKADDVPEFRLSLLATLQRGIKAAHFPVETGNQLFIDMAKLFIVETDFSTLRTAELRSLPHASIVRMNKTSPGRSDGKALLSVLLLGLLSHLINRDGGGNDLIVLLVDRFDAQASRLPMKEFYPIWVPFFRDLIPLLEKNQIPLDTPLYQRFFLSFFNAFLNNYVQREPLENKSLARPVLSCLCRDCAVLSGFLSDSSLRGSQVTTSRGRCGHLREQLTIDDIDCSHKMDSLTGSAKVVVTKTNEHYRLAHEHWEQRLARARADVEAFGESQLRLLLGQNYDKIRTSMCLVRTPQQAPCESSTSSRGAGDIKQAVKPAPKPAPKSAKATAQATKPTTQTTMPATQATKPASRVTKPESRATKRASRATKPATQATKPATKATKAATQALEPTAQAGTARSQTPATRTSSRIASLAGSKRKRPHSE